MPAKGVSHWKEYRAALSATLIMASAGTAIGWTSPTLPFLQGEDSPIPITADEGSWLASLMILFSTLSALPAAYLTEIWGRKLTMLLAAVPYIISWVLVITAKSVAQLYVSRLLAGVGYGIIYTVGPMYLGEISSDEVRGSLAILITVMNKLGILLQYCIGPYVSMTGLASFNLVIPTVFFFTFMWQPESPYYYVKKNKFAEAENALRRLRSSSDINNEMKKIELTVNEDMKDRGKWIDLFRDSGNRKALKITLVLFATQQVCGSAAVISYAQIIFGQAEGTIGASDASIILGCVQLFVAGSSFFLVDRLGRRPLLLVSSLGVVIMNTIIGAYFFFKDYKMVNMESVGFLPIFAIVIYIISYTIGLSTVPMAVTSEMFPTNVKSYATSVLQLFVGLSTFTVTKLYQVIADGLGTYTVFWIFSFSSLIGLIYIFVNLPETKGRSFVDIQHHLRFVKRTASLRPARNSESDVSQNEETIMNTAETENV